MLLLFRYFATKEDLRWIHHAVVEVEQLTTEILLESLEFFYLPQNRLPHVFCKIARAKSTRDQICFTKNYEFYGILCACTLLFVFEPSKMNKVCSCGYISSLQCLEDCCLSATWFLYAHWYHSLSVIDLSSRMSNLVQCYVAIRL